VEERRAARGPGGKGKWLGPASPPTAVGRHETTSPSDRGGGGEARVGRGGVRGRIWHAGGDEVEERWAAANVGDHGRTRCWGRRRGGRGGYRTAGVGEDEGLRGPRGRQRGRRRSVGGGGCVCACVCLSVWCVWRVCDVCCVCEVCVANEWAHGSFAVS
jgi:hypothetical protein